MGVLSRDSVRMERSRTHTSGLAKLSSSRHHLPKVIAMGTIALAAGACRQNQGHNQGSEVYLEATDSTPAFDAYLTWRDFDGMGDDICKAVFLWNGDEIGTGDQGIDAVLAKLRSLPGGSRVLVYPSCYLKWQSRGNRLPPLTPWVNSDRELADTLKERQLTLIHSPRDEKGNLLEVCKDPGKWTVRRGEWPPSDNPSSSPVAEPAPSSATSRGALSGTDATDILQAKRQLCRLAEVQRAYAAANMPYHNISFTLKELIASDAARKSGVDQGQFVDPWGTRLYYNAKGGIIISAGPDMIFGTKDDLSIFSANYRRGTGPISTDAVTDYSPFFAPTTRPPAWD